MKVLRWVWKHLWLLGILIAGVAAFALGSRSGVLRGLANEREAIDDGERARLLAVDKGEQAAHAALDREHAASLELMEVKHQAKSDRLSNGSPARRARFLRRVARKRADDPI